MDAKVIVTADKAGNVIVKSANNAEYGHIRVEQTRMLVDENGFARKKKLSALIAGTIEDLNGFGWGAGEEVTGKIIVKEACTPFNSKDPERDYKIAGASGVVCTADNAPIYRKHFFTLTASSEDVLIDHDNHDEIKAAYAAIKADAALQPNEDFNL
jgi:hypothetical protein